ncbi:hypothetical protein DFH09DRAFT_805574, partial [Mycena vulgaris]
VYPLLSRTAKILAKIFIHCLPDQPIRTPWPTPHSPPLLLSQICRRWRETVLNTSVLW